MKLYDRIEEKESVIPQTLLQMKSQKIPLVLLGAGDRGRCVFNFLKRNGIAVSNITTNRDFYKPDKIICVLDKQDIEIECFEDVIEKYKKINIILGFSKFLLPKRISDIEKIENIYSLNIGLTENYNFSYEYYYSNRKALEQLYDELEDKQSKELLAAHLNGRIQGIDMDFTPAPWSDPQYFLEGLMEWKDYECVMDCGAYIGDTAEEFISKAPDEIVKEYKIYCWEPEPYNFHQLESCFQSNPNVIPLPYASFEMREKLHFNVGDSGCGSEDGCISSEGTIEIQAESIDTIAENSKVTFIKMDVEGSELSSLKGARKTIRRDRPRLAICLYHKPDDLVTIPAYIRSLIPDYRMFLRTHSTMPSELVLFCI